jgi:hypothetical protein
LYDRTLEWLLGTPLCLQRQTETSQGDWAGAGRTSTITSVSRSSSDNPFRQAFRETLTILAAWAVFCIWVVGYSGWQQSAAPGSSLPAEFPVRTVCGLPAWVFWGVALPWVLANVFTIWFCLARLTDDEPEEPADG